MAVWEVSMCSSSATPTIHIVDDYGYSVSVNDFIVYYDDVSYDYYTGKVCGSSSESAGYSMEYNVSTDPDGYLGVSPGTCAAGTDYIENYNGYSDNATGTNTNCSAGPPSTSPTPTPTPTPSLSTAAPGTYLAGKFWYQNKSQYAVENHSNCSDYYDAIYEGWDSSDGSNVRATSTGSSITAYITSSGFAAGIKIFLNPQLTDHIDSDYEYDAENPSYSSNNTLAFSYNSLGSTNSYAGFAWQETTNATTKKYMYWFSFEVSDTNFHDSRECSSTGEDHTDGTIVGPLNGSSSATTTVHKILYARGDGSSNHDAWVCGHPDSDTDGPDGGYEISTGSGHHGFVT